MTEPVGLGAGRWELGSEFHWCGLPEPPFLTWPSTSIWYMLARHAVADLVRHCANTGPKLWLPSYFCPEVQRACQNLTEIREYSDDPRWPEPDWRSLTPSQHDIVLAVNYFGLRHAEPWKLWRERVGCILVEDHSQDPFSHWALASTADYAFASVRKTVPVPDGALLWSPRHLPLPEQPEHGDWTGSALRLAAMFHKAEYLVGRGGDELKHHFRELQLRGEQTMRASRISAISPSSFAYVRNGVPQAWRERRRSNALHLLEYTDLGAAADQPFLDWPDGAVPFVFPLLFRSQSERDECQYLLQRNKIYCPVHWVVQTHDRNSIDLSHRILSVPIDQRYGIPEIDRIAHVLLGRECRAQRESLPSRAGSQ